MPALTPLVGAAFDGAHLTERELRDGTVGEPVWGPRGLLADLELRLDLGPLAVDTFARVAAAREHAEAIAARDPDVFWARSLGADPWGTAQRILAMRDALVDAGWDAARSWRESGPRIHALAALHPLPNGEPDRLARVQAALAAARGAVYPRLERLVSSLPAHSDWSPRWERVFASLAAAGTAIVPIEAPTLRPDGDTDLASVRRALDAPAASATTTLVRRDGTLVYLGGETPEPLAEAVAAYLAARPAVGRVAVLRTADFAALEASLPRFGLPRLGGLRSAGVPLCGAWLPLVLALARSPFDVEAAVDLVSTPGLGLDGRHRGALQRQLARMPGLGPAWRDAVAALASDAPAAVERLLAWTAPDADLTTRLRHLADALAVRLQRYERRFASREDAEAEHDALQAARTAVQTWLRALPDQPLADGAVALADELLRAFGTIQSGALTRHEAGHLERIDEPAALAATVDTLIWWGAVDRIDTGEHHTFTTSERQALAAAGVLLEAPAARLLRRDADARAALGRARQVVLVAPDRVAGARQTAHPLWAAIRGRMGWQRDEDAALLVWTPETLAQEGIAGSLPAQTTLSPARPEAPQATWQVPSLAQFSRGASISVSALETWLSCPLAYVLSRLARVRKREAGDLAMGPLLYGTLGHRTLEELARAGRLNGDLCEEDVVTVLRTLIPNEAAVLLRSGRAQERERLSATLARSLVELVRWLDARRLRIVAVEAQIAGPVTCYHSSGRPVGRPARATWRR